MSNIAIVANKLSKKYHIGTTPRSRYSTLREALAGVTRRRAAAYRSSNGDRDDIYWALRDVELQIPRGETIGIIGRNGAGKSTLLKILARITPPTSGSATVFGRVGSLLEVGTGFHMELTGRENIYLSGAVCGMRKREIHTHFDSIVQFASVEKFIDTPVKHYSTGMYLRLAFAVAAHLQSEILLVDEVLSVGDAAFQQRCLGKMGEVAREGRTVLFVSHNMGAVRSLCTKGIVLDQGRVMTIGDVSKCTNAYFQLIGAARSENGKAPGDEAPSSHQVFGRVTVCGDTASCEISQSKPIALSTHLSVPACTSGFTLYCILEDMDGNSLFCLRRESHELLPNIAPGMRYRVDVTLPTLWLSPGLYAIHFKVFFRGEFATASRHLSDKFPLDIVGESSVVSSILHPQAVWSLTSGANGSGAL